MLPSSLAVINKRLFRLGILEQGHQRLSADPKLGDDGKEFLSTLISKSARIVWT